MGLDMQLEGDVYHYELDEEQRKTTPVRETYQLGRWWNWHRLHDYLVDEFAEGELTHQELAMDEDVLRKLLAALSANAATSDGRQLFSRSKEDRLLRVEVAATLTQAIAWLKAEQLGTWRSVWYRAT